LPIYFFDTSALVKLYHREAGSDFVEGLTVHPNNNRIFVSPLALIEMESAFAIKSRSGKRDLAGVETARRRFRADLARHRILVSPRFEDRHFQYARTCVATYGAAEGLRTLDALQLSMAHELLNSGVLHFMVAADQRLCRVARKEGIDIIDPQSPEPPPRTP
jgi:predicted nucleic acid-binding protein